MAGVIPDPPGVEGAATGRYDVSCAGTGELPHRLTYVVEYENASVREGGGVVAKCPVVMKGTR